MMYIRIFSIAVLTGVSLGTNIDAAPAHNSRFQQELTPLPIDGVRGSSTATDIRALESGRRTSCLNKLIRNQTLQKKNLIKKKFKNKLKACKKLPKKKQKACRRKAAAWKKKQEQNIKIDYAVVRDRCGGACFESGELKVAFDLYTRGGKADQKQMKVLHGKIDAWPTCSATHLDYLCEVESEGDDSNDQGYFAFDDNNQGYSAFDELFGHDYSDFNGDLSSWDVSSITSMQATFKKTIAFNGDISAWDTSSVASMGDPYHAGTFQNSRAFNGNISTWDTSSVTSMKYTFASTWIFDIDLSAWDISNVSSAFYMFYDAYDFSQCLEWSFKPGTDTVGMFHGTTGRISDKC